MCTRGVLLGRAAPCTCRGRGNCQSNSRSWLPAGWRGGSGGGGRRKPPDRPSRWRLYVRALAKQCFASKAPSPLGAWPRHPCRGHPRHRTHPAFDSFPRSAGTALGVSSVFLRKTDLTPDLFRYLTDVSTKVDTYQQPRRSVRGGAVWGVSRMDAAAKPPGTDSRRPRTPTPPRPPTECPLLTLTLLLRLPASGRHYSRCRAASPAETLPDHDCSHLPECPPLAKVEELT